MPFLAALEALLVTEEVQMRRGRREERRREAVVFDEQPSAIW